MSVRGFAGKPGWFREQVPGEGPGLVVPGLDLPALRSVPDPPPPDADAVTWLAYTAELIKANTVLSALVLQELREQVQVGVVYAVQVTVSTLVPLEVLLEPPLFTISITNDGPGTLQYRVPNSGSAVWVNLFPNEVVIFNAIKGVFSSAAFRVQGAAAVVRVVGVY